MIQRTFLQKPYSLAVPGSSGTLWAMRMKLLTVLIPFLLVACVTTAELDDRLGLWVGRSSDELATDWGAPSGTYTKKDGGSILTYNRMSVITVGTGENAQTVSRSCRVDFTTDKDGKILSSKWQGAKDQCDQVIP